MKCDNQLIAQSGALSMHSLSNFTGACTPCHRLAMATALFSLFNPPWLLTTFRREAAPVTTPCTVANECYYMRLCFR
jgi:hypothetical protein